MNAIKFTTNSGKQIELQRPQAESRNVVAYVDGYELGAVKASATAKLGWHLTTGTIATMAITVSEQDQAAVKMFLSTYKYTVSEKDLELKQYYDDHEKVTNASFGST